MEMGLFSAFDPYTGSFCFNFLILTIFYFNPMNYWYFMSRYMFIYYSVLTFIKKEFEILVGKKLYGGMLIYISLFFFVLQFNFMGMFPFIFAVTSQLNLNIFFAILFFVIFLSLGAYYKSSSVLAHLTPLGSPLVMSPFLVVIEIVSLFIRPFTLAVRLTANIVSGHILMEIILGPSSSMSILMYLYYFFVLPLLALEMMVCFVQAFVISSLSSLYLGEPLH